MMNEVIDLPETVTWQELIRAINEKLERDCIRREDLRILAGPEVFTGGAKLFRLSPGARVWGVLVV